MKNKGFKTAAIAAALALCCGVQSAGYVSADSAPAKEAFDPTYAIVNDFEKISDLYELDWYGSFGVAELNTDAKYITSGSASMRLNPIGNFKAGTNPTYIKIPLNRDKDHEASKMTSVSFDVFNASEKDGVISCALAIDGTNTKYVDFSVNKGERKTVRLEYDLVAMSAVYDVTKTEGIYVKFPKAESRETASANVWYVDKFSAEYTPFASSGYQLAFGENEFCSFDERYQEYAVNVNCGTGSIDGYRPELSVNTNPLFCADRADENFVFGKNKSLKLVAKAGLSSGNPGFTFDDKIWHSFKWDEMNDKALTFEVYNDSGSVFSFGFTIFRNPDNYQPDYYDRYSKSFEVPAYSWATITLPIKEWNESTKNTNGNPMNSYVQYGKVVYTYGTPFFIYNGASVGTADRTFYFDNFRIVDVNA